MKKFSLAKFDMGNLGTEIWLCENAKEAMEAFEEGGDSWSSHSRMVSEKSAGITIVLRSCWGNDIPKVDEEWLRYTLERSHENDQQEVEELIRHTWLDKYEY